MLTITKNNKYNRKYRVHDSHGKLKGTFKTASRAADFINGKVNRNGYRLSKDQPWMDADLDTRRGLK